MIQCQLKLKLTRRQEAELEQWLFHLAAVWNWAIRKIELDVNDHIYYSKLAFKNLLPGHSQKLGIPSHVLQGVLMTAHQSWQRHAGTNALISGAGLAHERLAKVA